MTEYERYFNVLTEISWAIFKQSSDLNQQQLADFFVSYNKEFILSDSDSIIKTLCDHSLLKERNDRVGFRYPYIYYFFVAKKIAEGFSSSTEIKSKFESLLAKLHREDSANILIFITHHTRDPWVINQIQNVLNSLFSENNRATLEKSQLLFMQEFIKQIPDMVLEQREIKEERENRNRQLDRIENNQEEHIEEPLEIFANINKTFKGMEIAGQIIRNRHATMNKKALLDLAKHGTSSGLRFLDYFIKISDTAKIEIINLVETQLEEHANPTDTKIQQDAEKLYLHLTYSVINGVIRKIASSIGSTEAEQIYETLEEEENTPAYTLLKQAIQLQFSRNLKFDAVEKTASKLRNNPTCLRILKEMVVQHIYMFPVEFRTKQQLSELLGISVQGQRLLDQMKQGKG